MTFHATPCRWEPRVMQAGARAGDGGSAPPDAELAAHLATCAGCRDLFEVSGAMARLNTATLEEFESRRLPAPGQLWWKAQLMQRWDAEARATAPVDLMQRTEVAGGVLAGAALLWTFWPDVQKLQSAAVGTPSGQSDWWFTLARLVEPTTFTAVMAGGVAVLGLLAIVTLRELFAD